MSAKNKKASLESRLSRGRKRGVGKPAGLCATFWNSHPELRRVVNDGGGYLRAAVARIASHEAVVAEARAALSALAGVAA